MTFLIQILIISGLLLLQGCTVSRSNRQDTTALVAERAITVDGQAIIKKGGQLLARTQAFRDAINNVAIEVGNHISADLLVGSTKVVDEWVQGNSYHVQVLTLLSGDLSCQPPYKKRLVATAFPAVFSGQISSHETQDLYYGIPREIMNTLIETGNFIGYNHTHHVLYTEPDRAPEIINSHVYGEEASSVIQLAQQKQAHFVLSGVIRDLAVESTEYTRGAGLLAEAKSLLRDFIGRRGIGFDVYVHDGSTGDLLFQHRYMDSALGDIWIPSGYSVGSVRFQSTPTGHKISQLIRVASQDIDNLLSCYPFSAKIIKIEKGDIYISAGSFDKMRVGDRLVIYSNNQVLGLQDQQVLGMMTIKRVQSGFSVGQMELMIDISQVKVGDLVKNW